MATATKKFQEQGKIGSKQVDESDIADKKIPVFSAGEDEYNLEYSSGVTWTDYVVSSVSELDAALLDIQSSGIGGAIALKRGTYDKGSSFNIPNVHQIIEGYNAISGKAIDLKEFLRVGERTVSIQRAFNAREGFNRKDDTLPKRFLTEPIKGGPANGRYVKNLDAMLDEYYEESGFDKKTGWPTKTKLEELDLHDVADELYKK